ncbi:MAG: hypothetical protein KAR87_05620 [Candidatus Aenigmarchaeota archaeon]|nr:hypothetical protein [Candidatus Aenigmarchaeota archaeon]
MNKKIITLEKELKEQVRVLESLRDELPVNSSLKLRIDSVIKSAKIVETEALGGKMLDDVSGNIKDVVSQIKSEYAKEKRVSADEKIKESLNGRDGKYWDSLPENRKREMIKEAKQNKKNLVNVIRESRTEEVITPSTNQIIPEKKKQEVAVKSEWCSEEGHENIRLLKKHFPNNVPGIYSYDKKAKRLTTEYINGITLREITEEKLKAKPHIITALGKIIAQVHNYNFVHGTLNIDNILLDKKGILKLVGLYASFRGDEGAKNIDYELLNRQKAEFVITGEDHIPRDLFSDKDINNIFFESYLINRNFMKISEVIIQKQGKEDKEAINALFELILFAVEKIREPTTKTGKYLVRLMEKIKEHVYRHHKDDAIMTGIFESFKEKIIKTPARDLKKIKDREAKQTRKKWINADKDIMRRIPPEKEDHWKSLSKGKRELIYDEIKRGKKIKNVDLYLGNITKKQKFGVQNKNSDLWNRFIKTSKIEEVVGLITKKRIPLYGNKKIKLEEYDIEPPVESEPGNHGQVFNISAVDSEKEKHELSIKMPRYGEEIKEEEFTNIDVFRKFLPHNAPEPRKFDKKSQTLIMDYIDGKKIEELSNKFFKDPKHFTELGRIIAVMHNHNFIHWDLLPRNIILDKKGIWKLIDFGESFYYDDTIEAIDLEVLQDQKKEFDAFGTDIIFCNCYDDNTNSIFYESYLVNRNFMEIAPYILRKKDKKTITAFFELIWFIVGKIKKPTGETRKNLLNLMEQIRKQVYKYREDDVGITGIFEKFEEKVEQNINIDLKKIKIKKENLNAPKIASLEEEYNNLKKVPVFSGSGEESKHERLLEINDKINKLKTGKYVEQEEKKAKKQGSWLNNFFRSSKISRLKYEIEGHEKRGETKEIIEKLEELLKERDILIKKINQENEELAALQLT